MRCNGEFLNDRICDMCKIVNSVEHDSCVNAKNERTQLNRKLSDIKNKCPHKKNCWDEYQSFWACNKNGDAYSGNAPECNCSLECQKEIV